MRVGGKAVWPGQECRPGFKHSRVRERPLCSNLVQKPAFIDLPTRHCAAGSASSLAPERSFEIDCARTWRRPLFLGKSRIFALVEIWPRGVDAQGLANGAGSNAR